MTKYIDADALKNQRPENLNNRCENYDKAVYASGWNDCNKFWCDLIGEMPAADVEPVRHGKWIKTDADFHDMPMEEFKCSMCGNLAHNLTDTTIPLPEFCDVCGAKMDGGSNELQFKL